MQAIFKSYVTDLYRLPDILSVDSMTSVALTTAVTVSPFFKPISSALRRVMTDSITASPTRTVTWTRTSPHLMSSIVAIR